MFKTRDETHISANISAMFIGHNRNRELAFYLVSHINNNNNNNNINNNNHINNNNSNKALCMTHSTANSKRYGNGLATYI